MSKPKPSKPIEPLAAAPPKSQEEILEERQKGSVMEKVTCECGAVITKKNMSTHLKSKKHLDLLTAKLEQEQVQELTQKELLVELPPNCLGVLVGEIRRVKAELELTQDFIQEAFERLAAMMEGDADLSDVDEEDPEEKKSQ